MESCSLLLGSAPSLEFELGEAVVAHAKKCSVHTQIFGETFLLFSTVPCLCPHQLHTLQFSSTDQCELCSSGMQSQGSWNLDCFSK